MEQKHSYLPLLPWRRDAVPCGKPERVPERVVDWGQGEPDRQHRQTASLWSREVW